MKLSDSLKEFYNLISPFLIGGQKTFIPIVYSFISCIIKKGENDFSNIEINIPRITKNCPQKPDEFILFFFKDNNSLKKQFSKEIMGNNIKKLRREFKILYPLLVLKDPFLNMIFKEELKDKKFYNISSLYKKRRKELVDSIEKIKESPLFEEVKRWFKITIETFFMEIKNNKNFRELIFEKLGKNNIY
jgi:hypothetical protein